MPALPVLFVSTPFDRSFVRDGSRLAIWDLARALPAHDVQPTIAIGSVFPTLDGVQQIKVRRKSELLYQAAKFGGLICTFFSPSLATIAPLTALRAAKKVCVVLPSMPQNSLVARAIRPDVVTSQPALERYPHARLIPLPFDSPDVEIVEKTAHPYVLYVGDFEFGDGIFAMLCAFESSCAHLHLAIASRMKTERSAEIRASIEDRVAMSPKLAGRVTVLGTVNDAQSWIASARAVVLYQTHTHAKLDHPRSLLEALYFKRSVIVGPAPSLKDLVPASGGRFVRNESELRDALRAADAGDVALTDASQILADRAPDRVAAQFAQLFRSIGC
jgi:hypothetical protein